MQSKTNIYDLESAHSEIGQAIHDAKRRLLDAHRKGVSLTDATETFFAEVGNVINRAGARLHVEPVVDGHLETPAPAEDVEEEELSEEEIAQLCHDLCRGEQKSAGALLVLATEIERQRGMFTTLYMRQYAMRYLDDAMDNHAALLRRRWFTEEKDS